MQNTVCTLTYFCLFKTENFPESKSVVMGPLEKPLILDLSVEDIHVLCLHKTKVSNFGLDLKQNEDNGKYFVDQVPKCFLNRVASAKYFNRESPLEQLVHDLAKEMAQTLRITRGGLRLLPVTISNVLKSQACRGKYYLS